MNLEAEIQKLNSKVDRIYNATRKKPCWVPASWIMKVTGWDKYEMEQAREQGIVEFREKKVKGKTVDGVFEYDVNSIAEAFLKNKN